MFDALGFDGCAGFVDTGFDLGAEGYQWVWEGIRGGNEKEGKRERTYCIVNDPFDGD